MSVSLKHFQSLVSSDRRDFHHVESFFKEPASRFVTKIVEPQILDVRTMGFARTLKRLADRLALKLKDATIKHARAGLDGSYRRHRKRYGPWHVGLRLRKVYNSFL